MVDVFLPIVRQSRWRFFLELGSQIKSTISDDDCSTISPA
jgi:hypothetical protein